MLRTPHHLRDAIVAAPEARPLWWLRPHYLIAGLWLPLLLIAFWLPADVYRERWDQPKITTLSTTLWTVTIATAVMVGLSTALSTQRIKGPRAMEGLDTVDRIEQVRYLYRRLLVICVAANLLAIVLSIVVGGLGPTQVLSIITGTRGAGSRARDALVTIPGLTTLAFAATPAAALAGWLRQQTGAFPPGLRWIFGLAIYRALINSERLALLEIVVALCIGLMAGSNASGGHRRRAFAAAPLLGLPAVVGLFAVFEYFRSWQAYRQTTTTNFAEFILSRLVGYYVTATNNGALLIADPATAEKSPLLSRPIADFPLLGTLYSDIFESEFGWYSSEVLSQLNPEFNSPSGFGLLSQGIPAEATLLLAVVLGWGLGLAYTAWRGGTLVGVVFYPLAILTILDFPRILYLTSPRGIGYLGAVGLALLTLQGRSRPATFDQPEAGSETTAFAVRAIQ